MLRREFFIKSIGYMGLIAGLPKRASAQVYEKLSNLKSRVEGLHLPNDFSFSSLKEVFCLNREVVNPDAIIRTNDTSSIRDVVSNVSKIGSKAQQKKFRIRCGGHSYEYFSMGDGIVCDVREFKHLNYHPGNHTAWIGSGHTLGEVNQKLGKIGRGIPTGSCPSVGVAGLTLGGGLGMKGRTYGLTCDRVRAMEVILADGQMVVASPENQYSDLYWAMLGGGGGNFGIVTEFQFETFKLFNEVLYSFKIHPQFYYEVFDLWENEICLADNNLSSIMQLQAGKGDNMSIKISGSLNNFKGGNPKQALRNAGLSEIMDMSTSIYYKVRRSDSVRTADKPTCFKAKSFYSDNGLEGDKAKYALIKDTMLENSYSQKIRDQFNIERETYKPVLIFGALGGKYDQPKYNNSYPHRNCRFSIELYRKWHNKAHNSYYFYIMKHIEKAIGPLMSERAYVNYPDIDLEDWAQRYYGSNLDRLIEVKKKYDPNNVFNFGAHSLSSLV